jgi:hypothetical protein
MEELPSYQPLQHKRVRTSITSTCKETGKQYFFVEFMGHFFPMPPTYTSPKVEYEEAIGQEGEFSKLARELTRRKNEKRFAALFEEADSVLKEIWTEDAKNGFGEHFAADPNSSWVTTASVSITDPSRLSRSFNSSSSLATPGVLSTYTTSMSSDGLLLDENDRDSACWSSPLDGATQIRIVPATPSLDLGRRILRKLKSPPEPRSLSTVLERQEGVMDTISVELRIGTV